MSESGGKGRGGKGTGDRRRPGAAEVLRTGQTLMGHRCPEAEPKLTEEAHVCRLGRGCVPERDTGSCTDAARPPPSVLSPRDRAGRTFPTVSLRAFACIPLVLKCNFIGCFPS